MKILAIECSAKPVSAAVISDGEVIGYAFSDIKLTHSQTLFPIIKSALDAARLTYRDIDAIGVAAGPGSFTGLRIGIASAKGLAEPNNLKCAGVSTLMAAAYLFRGENAVICPVLDARCGQVYNALFEVAGNTVSRLCDDRALMIDDLIKELESIKDKRIILCCDAAKSVYKAAQFKDNLTIAPSPLILQNAMGVAYCAKDMISRGEYTDAAGIMPVYLKLPQAQKELKAKQQRG